MTNRADSLGARLRRLRIQRQLTQTALAAPHYSAAYISTIEAGRRNPSQRALQHLARRLGVDPEELRSGIPSDLPVRLELQLQETFSELFSGAYEAADARFQTVEAEAGSAGLVRIEAKALEGRGLAAERMGEPALALGLYEEAIARLSDEAPPLRAEATAGTARCYQMLGNVRLAVHILETYLLVLQRQDLLDPMAMMRTYSSLIWPLSELGLEEQASFAASEALRLETKVSDAAQIANMHLNVARELFQQGRQQDCLASLKRAEDLYRSLNWTVELARAHGNRAIVLAERGDFAGARAANLQALELLEGTSSPLTRARALNELARVERMAGDVGAARRALTEAMSLLEQLDVAELALTNKELAQCHAIEHNWEAAEQHFRTAIGLFARAENRSEVAVTYRLLGDLLRERGRDQAASDAYREGLLSLESPAA